MQVHLQKPKDDFASVVIIPHLPPTAWRALLVQVLLQ